MTPEEAVVAAHIMRAKRVVPIHYGALHKAELYVETPYPAESLRAKAAALGIRTETHAPGAWFELA